MLLLCAAALVTTCRAACKVQRVVIIGAGVAGAAAANKILASNAACFKVRETYSAHTKQINPQLVLLGCLTAAP